MGCGTNVSIGVEDVAVAKDTGITLLFEGGFEFSPKLLFDVDAVGILGEVVHAFGIFMYVEEFFGWAFAHGEVEVCVVALFVLFEDEGFGG